MENTVYLHSFLFGVLVGIYLMIIYNLIVTVFFSAKDKGTEKECDLLSNSLLWKAKK